MAVVNIGLLSHGFYPAFDGLIAEVSGARTQNKVVSCLRIMGSNATLYSKGFEYHFKRENAGLFAFVGYMPGKMPEITLAHGEVTPMDDSTFDDINNIYREFRHARSKFDF